VAFNGLPTTTALGVRLVIVWRTLIPDVMGAVLNVGFRKNVTWGLNGTGGKTHGR
jgi:hypothetical protein